MNMMPIGPVRKIDPFTKFLATISGFDVERLQRCPPHDWGVARVLGLMMLAVATYQATLLSLASHKVFAEPGQINPGLIVGSIFIAIFILLIDSFMVMRSGLHMSGLSELKRGGIDLAGGIGAKIKAGIFLTIRLLLTLCMAQIMAVFVGLVLYSADISTSLHSANASANTELIADATAQTDADIASQKGAVDAQTKRVEELSKQSLSARQAQITPASADPRMGLALDEVSQLTARLVKAQDDQSAAQIAEANELGGINTKAPGDGPRHRAAVQKLANANKHLQEATEALTAARARVDDLSKQQVSADPNAQSRLHEQGIAADGALANEEVRLAALRQSLADLEQRREETIRHKVEAAPGYMPPDKGLLGQIRTLEHLASGDQTIAVVLLLIDFISFGLEAAAVLAKLTSFVPTTYARTLARDAYMQAARMADDIASELATIERGDRLTRNFPMPANDNATDEEGPDEQRMNGSMPSIFSQPPRRPRGRPRKQPPDAH